MLLNISSTSLKILYMGILVFCVTISTKANNKDKKQNITTNQTSIIEEKTGVCAKNDKTLTSLYNEVIDWLKTPYRRGGMSHKGMDCSGLTLTIYKNVFNIDLQRRSRDISNKDVEDLSKDELEPGDLVFFSTSRQGKGINHVGVYLGNDHFVHASCTKGVIISSLREAYYKRTWVKGGRAKNGNNNVDNVFEKSERPDIKSITTQHLLINETGQVNDHSHILSSMSKINTL